MSKPPDTRIDIRDDSPTPGVGHRAAGRVYINGSPVAVERGSVKVTHGQGEMTRVTMTFFPSDLRFNNEENA